jgi:hypothetical protein
MMASSVPISTTKGGLKSDEDSKTLGDTHSSDYPSADAQIMPCVWSSKAGAASQSG